MVLIYPTLFIPNTERRRMLAHIARRSLSTSAAKLPKVAVIGAAGGVSLLVKLLAAAAAVTAADATAARVLLLCR